MPRIEYGDSGRVSSQDCEVSGQLVGETEKAYKFFDGERTVWLPKSQVAWEEPIMLMPEWLAKEKELI